MKKRVFGILSVILILSMVFTTAASAGVLKASNYFHSCSAEADANVGTGKARIKFSVIATAISDSIGASSIVIQRKNGSTWTDVYTYSSSTTLAMLGSNSLTHNGSVTYSGTSGYEYRGVVTLYVRQGSGSETKTLTSNSVTAP
jgi:hypothetical protein